ncbi:hypothetical protein [Microbacterium sp. 5K110]|jgi:hypothetical protein|uniref:hypothetical protein n=1 Tax=unclassified Microbacterium TaxID=2609290 RepID=UPI0010FE9A8B|nr:hypothetical protein [Microbacterium sp. 5K110]TLF33975.1 hypothetical protein FE256_02370 [Microbacterium sp. 5K110]
MSRHHIATHVYDYREGWVRIAPTAMTYEHALDLRDQGFTLVRSRRGWFGTRELPVSWYIRRGRPESADPSIRNVSPAPEQAPRPGERLRDVVEHPPQPAAGRARKRDRDREAGR